jgi:hypothetical protein
MSNKVKKWLILLLSLLVFALSSLSLAYASVENTLEAFGDLNLRRTAPASAYLGQEIWVVMEIENRGNQSLSLSFVEKLGDAEFDKFQAKAVQVSDPGPCGVPPSEGQVGLTLWYYEWEIKLLPGESATLAYWLLPRVPGTYVISPAEINVDGEIFHTKSRVIQFKCRSDAKCDVNMGENVLTCPEDCFTGMGDGFCDAANDGRVDPDCEEGFDPDAAAVLPTVPALPVEVPSKDLTLYLVLMGAFLAIVAVIVIVAVLILRGRRPR